MVGVAYENGGEENVVEGAEEEIPMGKSFLRLMRVCLFRVVGAGLMGNADRLKLV